MKVYVIEESVAGDPFHVVSIHKTLEGANKRKRELYAALENYLKDYYTYTIEEREVLD